MGKKIILLLVILLIGVICIIFFNINKEDYYLKFANKVVDLYDGKYDTKGIKSKDIEAFNNFYDKLQHKNEKLDITKYFTFTDEYKVINSSSLKAKYEDNKCYIYYDDLTLWDNYAKADEGQEVLQHVNCNGFETVLFETMFLPPYSVIVNDPKYNYIIDKYNDGLSGYTFEYKSTYDDTPLTIKLIMKNKKITEIEAIYD